MPCGRRSAADGPRRRRMPRSVSCRRRAASRPAGRAAGRCRLVRSKGGIAARTSTGSAVRSTTTTKSCQQTRHFTSQPDGHPSASVSVQQLKKDGGGAWPHLREGAAVAEVRRRHKTADRIVRHVEGRRDERADAGVVPAEPDVVGVGGELVGARWAVRRAARRQEVPTLSRLTDVRTFGHRSLVTQLSIKIIPRHRVARPNIGHSQRRKEGREGGERGER